MAPTFLGTVGMAGRMDESGVQIPWMQSTIGSGTLLRNALHPGSGVYAVIVRPAVSPLTPTVLPLLGALYLNNDPATGHQIRVNAGPVGGLSSTQVWGNITNVGYMGAPPGIFVPDYHVTLWSGVTGVSTLQTAYGNSSTASVTIPSGTGVAWGHVMAANYPEDPGTQKIDYESFSLEHPFEGARPVSYYDFVDGHKPQAASSQVVSATLTESMPWAAVGLTLY